MKENRASGPRRIRRLSRPYRVVSFAIIIMLLMTATFFAGRLFQPPELKSIEASGQDVDVWAAVEERVVDDRATYSGVVKQGDIQNVLVNSAIQPEIIVKQTLAVGANAGAGSLVGVVSGAPYFFLSGPLPLFRDLRINDSGDDVLALQKSLNLIGYSNEAGGIVDWTTVSALESLFGDVGYSLPRIEKVVSANDATDDASEKSKKTTNVISTEAVIPYRQFLALPANGGVVVGSAVVGAALSADTPIVSIQTSSSFVEFIADVAQVDKLKVGDSLYVRSASTEILSKISEIGEFQQGKDGSRSGRPVRLVPTDTAELAKWPINQGVTVLGSGTSEQGLAVPLPAIRQDAGGVYILKKSVSTDGSISAIRVSVSIVRSGSGYAVVSGAVYKGEQVRVS